MDTGEWKESDAETAVYLQKWVSALVHATLAMYLGLAVYKCTGPACVNINRQTFKIQV